MSTSQKKKVVKKQPKKRADQYEPKVKFDGSFNDLVNISIKDANKKKKSSPKNQG